ncbi:MAG: ATP-binding cassette domain-containing protein [Gemmataceae bacterium]
MIVVDRISIVQGAFRLDDVSFAIEAGRYAVLMGRTGSGKTTVIEAIAGLRPVAAGRILLDGRDVTRLSPAERGVGYVPQDGALFPTMTVYDNLAFPLVIRNVTAGEAAIRERVRPIQRLPARRISCDASPSASPAAKRNASPWAEPSPFIRAHFVARRTPQRSG